MLVVFVQYSPPAEIHLSNEAGIGVYAFQCANGVMHQSAMDDDY